jgi:hypothetical protein
VQKKIAAPPVVDVDDATALDVAQEILGAHPPLDANTRAAFARQVRDDEASALGGKTKSDAVVACAADWVKTIDVVTRKTMLPTFGVARLVWMCELLIELLHRRAEMLAQQTLVTGARRLRDTRMLQAKQVSERLGGILDDLARGDHEEETFVAAADHGADSADAIRKTLRARADLAEAWLATKDPVKKALVATTTLSQGDVDTARAQAKSLPSVAAAAVGGHIEVRDTPDVNRAEGKLLGAMRFAFTAFARAHEADAKVGRLTPRSSIAHVFGGHPMTAKSKTPPSPPETPPTPPAK